MLPFYMCRHVQQFVSTSEENHVYHQMYVYILPLPDASIHLADVSAARLTPTRPAVQHTSLVGSAKAMWGVPPLQLMPRAHA